MDDNGYDASSATIIDAFDRWAERLCAADGDISNRLEHVPASVAVMALLRAAVRRAKARPDLFTHGIVSAIVLAEFGGDKSTLQH